jgi:hypothetical protein
VFLLLNNLSRLPRSWKRLSKHQKSFFPFNPPAYMNISITDISYSYWLFAIKWVLRVFPEECYSIRKQFKNQIKNYIHLDLIIIAWIPPFCGEN